MSALRRKLWRELGQLRGQIAAIALVLAGGIGTVVMALSNYQALTETRARYYSEHRFADVFANLTRAPRTLLPAIADLPGVSTVDARVTAQIRLQLEGFGDPISGELLGLPPPGQTGLNAVFLREGGLPLRDDEIVVIETFAEAHALHPGDRLSAIINGRQQTLRISGVGLSPDYIYPIAPGSVFPDFPRYAVLWMRAEPLARAFDMDGAFNQLNLRLSRGSRAEEVIDHLDRLLAPYGSTGAYPRALQTSYRFLDEELTQLQLMSRLFGGIFLAVAAFLLNIVIGRLVHSQREQIGLLKAFGYRGRDIIRHYAELVLLIGVIGTLPGIALGAWLGHGMAGLYQSFYRFPYLDWQLDPSLALRALLLGASAALFGATAALWRAYRLPPAEAMRPETPPRYRQAWAERLGLGLWMGPQGRMVLRSLSRRPLRTGLSVLGIGLAAGILVMAQFQSAAIEHMVAVQFRFAQRDDFSLSLSHPRANAALQELAAIEGVQRVEAYRAVPVRLSHGHREWRGSLQGLPADGNLKRVLDRELQPQALPEDGLLLTDYLAQMLRVRVGDVVRVEVLSDARQQFEVQVAGVVSEYLGVGAYTQGSTLNRWLGEGELGNGAWLSVQAEQRQQVLAALQQRPLIAAINDREAMIRGFRDTMAEGVLTFTLIATLLAGSIALGVVYNAARLTLSERGRELASLRVLGYTRAETRALLQGELFTLSLLALPLGFALGYGLCALLVAGFQSELYRIPLLWTPSGYGWASLTILAATVLSVVLVRRRLDRLDLIAVLKTRD